MNWLGFWDFVRLGESKNTIGGDKIRSGLMKLPMFVESNGQIILSSLWDIIEFVGWIESAFFGD
jgi:hypothetical protein